MNTIGLKLFRMAAMGTVGVVGVGRGVGAVQRCMECPWTKREWGPCGGFGEGCLTRQETGDRDQATAKAES